MRLGVTALRLTTEDDFRKAGVARHTISVIDALARIEGGDDTFDVFVPQGLKCPPHWSDAPRMRLVEVPPPPKRLRRFVEHFTTERHLLKAGVDSHLSIYAVVPFRPKLPTVSVVYDAFPKTNPELYLPRDVRREQFFQSSAARYADLIVTISEWCRDEIATAYHYPKERIRVVPCGIGNDLHAADPNRALGDYLFALSTLEPRKNLPRLLEAFAKVHATEAGKGLRLLIGGGMGWKAADLKQQAESLGLKESAEFLGYVRDEDLQALYEGARAFVFPALLEGFGIPALEAMTVGVPIVTSNTSALPEVTGDCAFYCEPESVDSIASAIVECLTNDEARREKVAGGLERAKGFSWDALTAQIIETCREAKGLRQGR